MLDDLERLLIRREGFDLSRPARPGIGAPAFLGKVTSTGTNIAAGKFLIVNPVEVTGTESEGGSGTFTVQSVNVPVYLVGPSLPATNDYLICRRVDHRWVADVGRYIPAGGGGPGNSPGCACQGTPATLSVTVSYGPGETPSTYNHAFQDSTLQWYAATVSGGSYSSGDHPSYLPASAYSGPGYYSSASWFDDFGQEIYYFCFCGTTQYRLAQGVKSGPSWSPPGNFYVWSIGAPNTCIPFSLTTGSPSGGLGAPTGGFDATG